MPRRIAALVLAVLVAACSITATAEPPEPRPAASTSASAVYATAASDEVPYQAAPTTTTLPPTTTTTPPPPPTTTTTQAPQEPAQGVSEPSGVYADPNDPATWDRLAGCETGYTYDWATNTGNGYFGGLQFSLSSWQAVGGTGYPHEHSRSEQIYRAQLLWNQGGWSHWPACSAKLGYR